MPGRQHTFARRCRAISQIAELAVGVVQQSAIGQRIGAASADQFAKSAGTTGPTIVLALDAMMRRCDTSLRKSTDCATAMLAQCSLAATERGRCSTRRMSE